MKFSFELLLKKVDIIWFEKSREIWSRLVLTGNTFSKGVQIFSKIKDEEISLIEFLAQFFVKFEAKANSFDHFNCYELNPFISPTGNGFFIVLLERKMKTPWSYSEKFHFRKNRRNILCMIFISSLTLMTFLKGIVWTCCHEVYLFPSCFSHVYTKMKSHCGNHFNRFLVNG